MNSASSHCSSSDETRYLAGSEITTTQERYILPKLNDHVIIKLCRKYGKLTRVDRIFARPRENGTEELKTTSRNVGDCNLMDRFQRFIQ